MTNGWIEPGYDHCSTTFKYVKDSDIVIRTENKNDAVVVCNGSEGTASIYVENNNLGIGMRPREFATVDVSGSIFCDTKIELCASDAEHPITYPKLVIEPQRIHFSNTPKYTSIVFDGRNGLLSSDYVLSKNVMGKISHFFFIPVKNVNTSETASDIVIDEYTFHKYFYLNQNIFIENVVTKIVQFSITQENEYKITLVPPIPTTISPTSNIKVATISEHDSNNNYMHTLLNLVENTQNVNNYNWKLKCKGIRNDIINTVDDYVAISTSKTHNYQKIVQIRNIKEIEKGEFEIQMTSPSSKNIMDLSEYDNKQMYIHNIECPVNSFWRKEYNVNLSFFIDSSKVGYYIVIENSDIVNMLSNSKEMEHLNAIDRLIIGDPQIYEFNIRKTYVKDGQAMLYIDVQSVPPNIPTMFSGYYDIKYKITGIPIKFNKITRLDNYTVELKCTGVQGYAFGDGVTTITSDVHMWEYLLLNDTTCDAWRIIKHDFEKNLIVIRCSDSNIVDQMDINTERIVYVIPFKGKIKDISYHNKLTVENGKIVLKDEMFSNPDTSIKYDGESIHLGEKGVNVKDDVVTATDFSCYSHIHSRNNMVVKDPAPDLEFINNISLVEFEQNGKLVRWVGKENEEMKINELLVKCIGSIKELNRIKQNAM